MFICFRRGLGEEGAVGMDLAEIRLAKCATAGFEECSDRHGGPQGAKSKAEVVADILASIKERRNLAKQIGVYFGNTH